MEEANPLVDAVPPAQAGGGCQPLLDFSRIFVCEFYQIRIIMWYLYLSLFKVSFGVTHNW